MGTGVRVGGDLVPRRVRSDLREIASSYGTVATVRRAFEDEGFAPADAGLAPIPGDADSWSRDGQRRGVFNEHAASVDWSDPGHVARALEVFRTLLRPVEPDGLAAVHAVLRDSGIEVDAAGKLRAPVPPAVRALATLPLDVLDDDSALREHLDRLERVTDDDPAVAISAAKALVEALCKKVLADCGEHVAPDVKMPALVKQANRALGLDPQDVAPTKPGQETITRVLSNLAQIPVGLAELRNAYGPDHGRPTAVTGLRRRHADLAVGAAATYVHFVLATLRDRAAAHPHDDPASPADVRP